MNSAQILMTMRMNALTVAIWLQFYPSFEEMFDRRRRDFV